MKQKNILVTGGAGFVGSHLVDRIIKEGPDNIVVASKSFRNKDNLNDAKKNFPIRFRYCDVSNFKQIREIIEEESIDIVFNLSVIPLPESLAKPEWSLKKNIDMTINLCRLLREDRFKTLIQFSSSEAIGNGNGSPMSEDHILRPLNPYAASKAATDHIALSYFNSFGCDVSVIRPFNQYGERQNAKKYAGVVPIMINKMLRNEEVTIFGNGNQTRDFIHVTDTANAAVEILKHRSTRGRILNVGSGVNTSINSLVKKIAEKINYKKTVKYELAREGDIQSPLSDISLIKSLTDWKPQVSFDDGLNRTIEWYQGVYS